MAGAAAVSPSDDRPNHPLAKWMGLIAGISHNMVVGCLIGSFSVMLASVEARMHVGRFESSIVGMLVIFGSAIIASFVGPLIARYSLRLLMFVGALLGLVGFLILAFTASYSLYVGVYLLLFGPSMAIAGSVGPATLVMRWFSRNRGLALGLVHLSIVVAIVPILSNWVLEHYGARTTYLMLGAMIGILLVPATLAIRDFPPSAADAGSSQVTNRDNNGEASLTVPQIIRVPQFWMLAGAAAVVITAIMMLTFNMVPLAESLGIDRDRGALLQATMSFSGMAGSVLFGWVADRIGGTRGVALIALNSAVLLGLLTLELPFPAMLVIVGLFGMHGAGMVPNVSRALAHALGAGSFSRAFGLQSALSVPLTAVGLIAMGASYTALGSYLPAVLGVAIALLIAAPLALQAGKGGVSRV